MMKLTPRMLSDEQLDATILEQQRLWPSDGVELNKHPVYQALLFEQAKRKEVRAMKNDPKTIAKLLRSIATGTNAKETKQDIILNIAADMLDPKEEPTICSHCKKPIQYIMTKTITPIKIADCPYEKCEHR